METTTNNWLKERQLRDAIVAIESIRIGSGRICDLCEMGGGNNAANISMPCCKDNKALCIDCLTDMLAVDHMKCCFCRNSFDETEPSTP